MGGMKAEGRAKGQEDQLGALGLVLNAIALWNTRYMDAALRQPRLGVSSAEELRQV